MNTELKDVLQQTHSCYQFSKRDIPLEKLVSILEVINYAPSGFNLQPWHFIIVRDESMRKLLYHVAFGQQQILDSPATVVFAANPKAWQNHYDKVLQLSVEKGAISTAQAKKYKRNIELFFKTSPLGLSGLSKRIGLPLRRLKRPTPNLITSGQEAAAYVSAQTMITAAMFIVAARAEGLGTHPTEGFDEYRLKKLLRIPRYMSVPIMINVGHPLDQDEKPARSVRIPIEQKVSIDLYSNTLESLRE